MNPYEILDRVVKRYKEIMDESLVGIYLHGSLAMGCYTEKSDIDFLVLVSKPIDFKTKRALIEELLLFQELPEKGIEMSVVLEQYAREFQYPTPFELHYSDMFKNKYKNDKNFICENGVDKDLASHMTLIEHRGVCLYGRQIQEVFKGIPEKYYIDSIIYDIENAKNDIITNPVYITLNLCRALYYLKHNVISSKLEGGNWGIENLPGRYIVTLRSSISIYTNQLHNVEWDNETLIDLADYMLNEIFKRIEQITKEDKALYKPYVLEE